MNGYRDVPPAGPGLPDDATGLPGGVTHRNGRLGRLPAPRGAPSSGRAILFSCAAQTDRHSCPAILPSPQHRDTHGRDDLVAISISSILWMGGESLPKFNEGTLTIAAMSPPGATPAPPRSWRGRCWSQRARVQVPLPRAPTRRRRRSPALDVRNAAARRAPLVPSP